MKFKKDGKVYDDIDALLHETCFAGTHYHCGSCEIKDKALTEQDSCYAYAIYHQREIAQYLGYEVIEDDTPTIAEAVEENSENVKHRLTRADILHAAEKCVCGQRETDYGTPEDNFKTIAGLWETYLRRACVDEAGGVYIEANDVAMMMALLKIARIAAGGGKADSWIDLAGYAACGAECEGVTE
jgi:hypothetical protein